MPKISNNSISIYHKEIRKDFSVVVMYNKDHFFYAKIPSEFDDIVNHLSDDQLKELFIVRNYKSRSDRFSQQNYTSVISADTEDECLARIKKCISALIDKAIKQRDVIIVFYNGEDRMNYNSHRYNDEHQQIGLKFGLTYAIESTVGDKKVYSTYTTYDSFGEDKTVRHEMSLWNEAATIIPDTKENRAMLENLYTNLDKLNNQLKKFTGSEEVMLEFISSNIKLLN